MKKLILMLLAALWGVVSVNAADDIYLRTDYNGSYWNDDNAVNKFKYLETKNNEDIYELTIDASALNKDIWFRLHISGWGAQICPYNTKSYTYTFSNGQNETYGARYELSEFQGDTYSFGISHTSIKANSYKITLYRGTTETTVDGKTAKHLWIKVEIIDMPATVSSVRYATFSCNRALDFTDVTALSAYKASVNDGKVVLTKVDGKVAANTGLLLAGTSANIPVVPTAEGVDISATNLLKASVTETAVAASTAGTYHYFLAGTSASDIGFYNVAEAATSGAGKAYLETTTALASEPASARVAWVFQDDETTGIKDATRSLTTNDVFFDLTGRRVKALRGGFYIKNGKKVIVK